MANPLSGCVNSLQSSISLLGSSIAILDSGVNDFPRLSKVLQTTRVSVSCLSASFSLSNFPVHSRLYLYPHALQTKTLHYRVSALI